MGPFGGWDLPIEYEGLAAEHLAVRTRAAVFDISHMGEIEVAGGDALPAVQRLTSNDASRLEVGEAQYSVLMTPQGTCRDDLLVYRLGPDHFLLMVNAATTATDYAWISEQTRTLGDVVTLNASARYAALAVQGPSAVEALQPLTGVELDTLRPFAFAHGEVAGVRGTISRTGYTGEDGFELLVPPQGVSTVWTTLLREGSGLGLVPAGLGARDTLRLEAGMRLYGADIDETTSLLEAGLDRVVGWAKTTFVGREALVAEREAGPSRRLVGLELTEPGIARHGHEVHVGEERVGEVTSGTRTPFLEKAIALAYVSAPRAQPGTEVTVDIRGRRRAARVVPLPFYRRKA